MKFAQHLARLFDKLVESTVIRGYQKNIESYHLSCHQLRAELKTEKEHRMYTDKMLDRQNDYIKQLMMEFERKGQMTWDEFCLWHNHYKNTVYGED